MSPTPQPADRFLEDLVPGERWSSNPVEVTAGDIEEFSALYDAGARGRAAGRAAPAANGWLLIALAMREFVRAGTQGRTPIIGMGADEIRWLKPVRAGAVLTFHREIAEVRRSASRPDRGVVTTAFTAVDQHGEVVMKMRTLNRVPARPAAST